ncbi:MAG: hypothetical protein Q7R22_011070 [Verrucomicrobiota bacterium JB025]|nr:hypothetical protein [Verrucomicrobiota bacterium JB025]
MATTNTSTKRRRPGRKAEDIHTVWTELAPDAVFAGKNPTDLEAAMTAYEQAQEPLRKLNLQRSAAVKTRDEKLAELRHLLAVIVRGVQGHADYGEDCSLYRAMGFVPKSERASGLSRKEGDDPAVTGQDETAA